MIRPMPFCPSLEPCAKLTPVQVSDQDAADPQRRRLVAFGLFIELRIAHDELQHQQQERRDAEAEQRREQQRVADLGRLGPVHTRGAVTAVHQRIGNADADDRTDQRVRRGAGRPSYQVPRFQMIAAISSANTIAKPAPLPTCRINSTGSSEMMPKAPRPLRAARRGS